MIYKTLAHYHIGGACEAFDILAPLHTWSVGMYMVEKQLDLYRSSYEAAEILEILLQNKAYRGKYNARSNANLF